MIATLTREDLVVEARSWIGTPYRLGQMLKGGGCDCGTLILGIAQACGLAQDEKSEIHRSNWYCQDREGIYLRKMMRHARLVIEAISYPSLEALPGDVVLTKHEHSARVYNHAGIVTKWPKLIHSVDPQVKEVDATKDGLWNYRKVAVFSFFKGDGC